MTSDKESTKIIDREKQLLIRNKQMMEIKNAMDSNVDNLFITGIPSTGKTLVLKSMMREVSNVAWINCVDCLSARIVFERALSQWFEFDDRCENEDQFVYQLQCFHQQGSRLILVLDKVDELMSIGSATLLPFLFRLRDISRVDIMMISISHLKFDTLLTLPLPYPPMTVQFPIYTKPEMINIIGLDCPETEDIGFFKSFIELIYNSFNSTCCQDLNELRYMVLMLFPKYIEPITNGLLERNQTSRLFSNIQKEIKDAFHNLYLRNISANEWNEHLETSSVLRVNTKRMDLPHYTKFLVMASFLASYNPARLDKRFFTRGGEGKTRVGKKGGV
ncbi:origin recognition complex subunit 5 C-terminus-domain-containing protein, partial [Globomyces pollinis-pini]